MIIWSYFSKVTWVSSLYWSFWIISFSSCSSFCFSYSLFWISFQCSFFRIFEADW